MKFIFRADAWKSWIFRSGIWRGPKALAPYRCEDGQVGHAGKTAGLVGHAGAAAGQVAHSGAVSGEVTR